MTLPDEGGAASPAPRRSVFDCPLARGVVFLATGALLHLAATKLSSNVPSGPVIEVTAEDLARLELAFTRQTGRPPDAELRDRLLEQEIDDRLLVEEARARGWHRNDPVIQRRLILNQRFLEADTGANEGAPDAPAPAADDTSARDRDVTLLARAYDQGMDRTDVVVKRRLLERMRLSTAEAARAEPVPRAELQAYLSEHRELFRRPERIDLVQVFVSRDRHGDDLGDAARAVGERLEHSPLDDDEALALGDPSLLPGRVQGVSRDELARRFGADFAAGAFEAGPEGFTGPIRSSFGLHFVRVTARAPERDPPLDEVLAAVQSRVEREREREALARFVAELQARAVIRRPESTPSGPVPARAPGPSDGADRDPGAPGAGSRAPGRL